MKRSVVARSSIVTLLAISACQALLDIEGKGTEAAVAEAGSDAPPVDATLDGGTRFCTTAAASGSTFCADFEDARGLGDGFRFEGATDASTSQIVPLVGENRSNALVLTKPADKISSVSMEVPQATTTFEGYFDCDWGGKTGSELIASFLLNSGALVGVTCESGTHLKAFYRPPTGPSEYGTVKIPLRNRVRLKVSATGDFADVNGSPLAISAGAGGAAHFPTRFILGSPSPEPAPSVTMTIDNVLLRP